MSSGADTILTLVRHGHTEWNGLGRYQGLAPVPLSERGRLQAEHLAQALAPGDPMGDPVSRPIQAIYSSDLLRCRQTAAPIAAALGLPVQFDPRLREADYGHWQGLTREEAARWDPEAYAAYRADPDGVAIPGGESHQMLANRVLAALADVLARHGGEHVLLVTHGGPLRAILEHYDLWQGGHPPGNASRTVIAVSPAGRAEVLLMGDVAHLPAALQPDRSGTTFIA
ncbi:MAG: histidine phosphatase family protein [Anaerolineae bacterium]|nr:histidine phosphatase family protein [Anaerolineae bacterium]